MTKNKPHYSKEQPASKAELKRLEKQLKELLEKGADK